jgi:hypothetical protein
MVYNTGNAATFITAMEWLIGNRSLFSELKRRNVFGVAVLYITSGWLLLQLIDILLALAGTGDWIYRFVFGLGIICFPLALIFSYLYEITPQGLRKEYLVERQHSITRRTGRKIRKAIIVTGGLALALEVARWLLG